MKFSAISIVLIILLMFSNCAIENNSILLDDYLFNPDAAITFTVSNISPEFSIYITIEGYRETQLIQSYSSELVSTGYNFSDEINIETDLFYVIKAYNSGPVGYPQGIFRGTIDPNSAPFYWEVNIDDELDFYL